MPDEQFQSFIKGINTKLTKKGKVRNVGVLFQALKAIPGGLEMSSVAMLEHAYNKILSAKNIKAIERIPKGGYLLLEADQTKNPHDRNLAIVRDQEGNYFVYLLVAEQRFDGTMHKDIEFESGKDNECLITLEIGGENLKVCAQVTSKQDIDPPKTITETDSVAPIADISTELAKIKGLNVLADTHTVFMLRKKIQFAPHMRHNFVKVLYSPLEDGTSVPFNSVVEGNNETKDISQTKVQAFLSVVEQLELLHKHGYVVRDLKGDNILFSSDEVTNQDKAYIIDYTEFIKLINSEPTTSTYVGTPEYLAPETQKLVLQYASSPESREGIRRHLETTFGSCYTSVKEASKMFSTDNMIDETGNTTINETVETEIADDFPVNKSIDIYALGIMLFECITLKRMSYPTEGDAKDDSTDPPILWTKQEVIDLINHDKAFIENQPLLSKMLAEDPQQRCSIDEVNKILSEMLQESKRLNSEADLKINEKNEPPASIEDLLNKFESDPSDTNKQALFNYAENLQRTSQQQTKVPSETVWCKSIMEELKTTLSEYTEKFLKLNNSKKSEEKARKTSFRYRLYRRVVPSLAASIASKEDIARLRVNIEHYDSVISNLGTPHSFRRTYTPRSTTS